MALFTSNIIYVPVQIPVNKPPSNEVGVSACLQKDCDSKDTQTDGIKKPLLLESNLQKIVSIVNVDYTYLQCRLLRWGSRGEHQALEVTKSQADIYNDKLPVPLTLAILTIKDTGIGKFHVAGDVLITQQIFNPEKSDIDIHALKELLEYFSSDYVFCAGIDKDEYEQVCSAIRYDPQNVIEKGYPYPRLIHPKCSKWFKLRHNAPAVERDCALKGEIRCPVCNERYRELRRTNKRQLDSLSSRGSRTEAGSKYPIRFLSPKSVKKRRKSTQKVIKRQSAQVKRLKVKLESYNVELEEEQSKELSSFLDIIGEKDVDAAMEELGEGDNMDALKATFYEDQRKNGKDITLTSFPPNRISPLLTLSWHNLTTKISKICAQFNRLK